MARDQSTPTPKGVDKFKNAIWRRTQYRLGTDEEIPLGGLNPYHKYYEESGLQLFRLILDHLRITKTDKVLEIGCGTGRIAAPFIKHIGNNYIGFDNNKHFINHCQTMGSNFSHHDIFHEDWNPDGKIDPLQFKFPYQDRQFTVVFSIAVFNHFRLSWLEHYLSEIARVLSKGGRLFCTLIIAAEPRQEITVPPFQFFHRTENEWYDYKDQQLYNIAFMEQPIRRTLIKNGLMLNDPIKRGRWNKSPLAITGHDVLIAHKRK
jgi:SAM-dependent methyltransferase